VQHDLLMSAALEQATRGLDAGEVPIGAVVALEGEILAAAFWRLEDGLLAHPELLVLLEGDRSAEIAGQRGPRDLHDARAVSPLHVGGDVLLVRPNRVRARVADRRRHVNRRPLGSRPRLGAVPFP
jgi:hypothetical protein